jgi:orotate phosphoribosyltransferase
MGEVAADLWRLASPQRGHFELGTGCHGDLWLDLDALFLWPARLRPYVRQLAERLAEHEVSAVCGPAAGGAFLAQALAVELGGAFLPAAQVTADGGPPSYRIAPSLLGRAGGWRVAVADDAVNAGTAVLACCEVLRSAGAVPVAVAALLAAGPAGPVVAGALSVPFHALVTVDSEVWPASACPLCAAGMPLSNVRELHTRP